MEEPGGRVLDFALALGVQDSDLRFRTPGSGLLVRKLL